MDMIDRVKIIFDYAKKRFGTQPEYLWKSAPNYAVLRNSINRKWYAIIMDVPKESLKMDGTGKIWVMNVKCDPMMIGSFINRKGFLPAYHMNKEHWLSVILNDKNIDVDEIINIIDMSYEIVNN